jgi:hypothetical protein
VPISLKFQYLFIPKSSKIVHTNNYCSLNVVRGLSKAHILIQMRTMIGGRFQEIKYHDFAEIKPFPFDIGLSLNKNISHTAIKTLREKHI